MTFAFNSITVLLIYIELLRYFLRDHLPILKSTKFDGFFKAFCDAREKKPDAFIMTHILLLMGCALPVTSQFITMSGGFHDRHWTIVSFTGLVFVGIGDTAVRELLELFVNDCF
jgi:hypothetical protein